MKARRGPNDPIRTLVLGVILTAGIAVGVPVGAATAAIILDTTTGVRATIHTAEEIQDHWLVRKDGRVWLRHPVAGEVELDTAQRPWSELVPVDPRVVAAAVDALQGFDTDVAVEIFLLPGFPADVMASFARRESVFLAPGLGPQAPETVAYVTTHELGHLLCWAAIDGRPRRWDAYLEARGLVAQDDPAALPHADRNREIIAEDLRFLFGGPQATASGTIENPRLPLPTEVAGLAELLVGFLADPNGGRSVADASRVYPNPCRDAAVVELDVEGNAAKTGTAGTVLEIYDIRGRLIRRVQDGYVSGGRASVIWDGMTADGRRAPAGMYVYRIRHRDRSGSGRLLLLAR